MNKQGNSIEALKYLKRALAIRIKYHGEKHVEVASLFLNIGSCLSNLGEEDSSLTYYKRSLKICLELFGEEHPMVAMLYDNIGQSLISKDDNMGALEYIERGYKLITLLLGETHPDVIQHLQSMGGILAYVGEHRKALEYQEKALQLSKQLFGEKHPAIANAYQNIGSTLYVLKDSTLAASYHDKAINLYMEIFGENSLDVAIEYYNLAIALGPKGQYKKAVDYFTKSLMIRLEVLGNKNPDVSISYNGIAIANEKLMQYEAALVNYQKAIIANVNAFNDTTILRNPSLNDVFSNTELLTSLDGKARMLKKGNFDRWKLSLSTYNIAANLVDSIRLNLSNQIDQIKLGETAFPIFEGGIDCAFKLENMSSNNFPKKLSKNDPENNNINYKDIAFNFAERAKAGTLRQLIQEENAAAGAGISDSLLKKEQQIKIHINYLEKAIIDKILDKSEEQDTNLIASLKDQLFQLNRQEEAIKEHFKTKYPKYNQIKNNVSVVNIQNIQDFFKRNANNSALIEYFVGDSALYVFCITSNHNNFLELPLDNLTQEVYALRRNMLNFKENYGIRHDSFVDIASKLYQKLIMPIKKYIEGKDLIIVRDGVLDLIPFECLLSSDKPETLKESNSYNDLPYLVQEYAISYALSATLFIENTKPFFKDQKDNVTKASIDGFLAFAPVFGNLQTENKEIADATRAVVKGKEVFLPPLPASEKEVMSLAKLFEKNKIFIRKNATETNLQAEIKRYKYVHLATHGRVDDKQPANSAIFFADDTTSINDGVLYAGEMFNLPMNAELITLSACETGLGKISKGDGLVGLTRGLIYSGAKNICVSLWSVADQSTAELMILFYQDIRNGKSIKQSIQTAKQHFIKNTKFSAPYYWAPFVLVGQ